MKKLLTILAILITSFWISKAGDLTVSWIVGSSNIPPKITKILPASNPKYIAAGYNQNFLIEFNESENETITYTITTENNGWATNITSWTIETSQYNSDNRAYINFVYQAPETAVGSKRITITLNDWTSVSYQDINIYIY